MPLSANMSIKLAEIQRMSWDVSSISVSPRPYHALALRIKGSAFFEHGKVKSETKRGDVFLLPANYEYNAKYSEKNEIIVIHFYSEPICEAENFTFAFPETIHGLFEKALDIWQRKDDSYYFSAMSCVCDILALIMSEKSRSYNEKTFDRYRLAVEYMENNYTDSSLTVERIISMSYMSGTYFRKIFYEKTGTTPVKHLILLRLSHAKKLLAQGTYSVDKAAALSGFSDPKYFSRLIKEQYGVPPSKLYRHIK